MDVVVMTLRQNKSRASGRLQCRHSQKHGKWSPTSSMLMCVFDIRVVCAEFLPPGQTVDQAFYLEIGCAKCEAEKARFVGDERLVFLSWKCTCIRSNVGASFLSQKRHGSLTPRPLFAWLCSVWLLFVPKNEEGHERTSFWQHDNVKKKLRMELVNIQTDEFEKCFQQWQLRLDKCKKLRGEYFESFKVVL